MRLSLHLNHRVNSKITSKIEREAFLLLPWMWIVQGHVVDWVLVSWWWKPGHHWASLFSSWCFTFITVKMPSRRKSGKNAPILSHEFMITNHGDIISCVCMLFMVGLMFQVGLSWLFSVNQFGPAHNWIDVLLPYCFANFLSFYYFSRQRLKYRLFLSHLNIMCREL